MHMTTSCSRTRRRCDWRRHRHTRRAPPVASDTPLACFIASHISSEARARALDRLLASIDEQQPSPPPPVYMSCSYAEEICRSRASAVVSSDVGPQRPWLRRLDQPSRHSQFEHIARLVNEILTSGRYPQWVIFSDDDDIWSPGRVEAFRAECVDAPRSVRAVLCRRKARPSALRQEASSRIEPLDAAEVTALLASGAVSLCDSAKNALQAGRGVSPMAYHRSEYFDFAVRFEALASFVRRVPAGLLRHPLCDLGFTRWLRDHGEVRTFLPRPSLGVISHDLPNLPRSPPGAHLPPAEPLGVGLLLRAGARPRKREPGRRHRSGGAGARQAHAPRRAL